VVINYEYKAREKLSSDGVVPFCSSASFISLPGSAINDQIKLVQL